MPSFQVPVLGPTDGFLLPFPDSLPQLFLRCFPYAFAFGLSPSNPLPFVRFSSSSGYSASVSSFPSLPGSASQLRPRCALPLSLPFPLSVSGLLLRFLSSASFLGSDYSASAFPFLLFPVPPRSCFPGARFRSRFLGFPFLSGLISHAFLPGSCTRPY